MNRYRAADLDLVSTRSLEPLREALRTAGLIEVNQFRRGRSWCAGFEAPGTHGSAERDVRAILRVLDGGSRGLRALLRACKTRTIDIAFDVSGGANGQYVDSLGADTVARLAEYGIGVRVTLYAAEK